MKDAGQLLGEATWNGRPMGCLGLGGGSELELRLRYRHAKNPHCTWKQGGRNRCSQSIYCEWQASGCELGTTHLKHQRLFKVKASSLLANRAPVTLLSTAWVGAKVQVCGVPPALNQAATPLSKGSYLVQLLPGSGCNPLLKVISLDPLA